jgi:predicted ATPase
MAQSTIILRELKMLLNELSITNYKSFLEKTTMKFGPGFNVLLGANSSGKTSVLEAIRFRDAPYVAHRSIANIIEPDTPWNEPPVINARFEISLNRLQRLVPPNGLHVVLEDDDARLIADPNAITDYWNKSNFQIEFISTISRGVEAYFFPLGVQSRKRSFVQQGHQWRGIVTPDEIKVWKAAVLVPDNRDDLEFVANKFHERIYRFSAERVVRATSGAGNHELLPDASNLPFCINHLRASDDQTFDQLNSYIHRIFPTIYSVGAVPNSSGIFELKVHTVPSHRRRSDLAVSMDRVGTGVSNAIAMLYVALTSHSPRIILLEEPNSFLHPRALRELLAILAEAGSRHQFFVTTHSSDVLRIIPTSSVTLLEHNGVQTSVRQTTKRDLNVFRAGLLDLGIRLTDLHGCDRVLWVEGETEEAIFPRILSHFFPESAQGVATLRLHATGDFEARKYRAEKVAEIYRRLSTATFLAPPMVAITLDREGKQPNEIERLEREGNGVLHFLPKPMLEDYLLISEAISAVLKTEFEKNVSTEIIEQALAKAASDPINSINPKNPHGSPVHAAKVLQSIFVEFGGDGALYDKTSHGPMLAEWILANKPELFDELKLWFSTLFSSSCI